MLVLNILKMCFKTYLNHPINQKIRRKKKNLRAITVLKKEGGGPARYDHDHRFNGYFFDAFPYIYTWKDLKLYFIDNL